ncbi:Zn-dependent peptidase ImmA (M78 family) [Psychromicrobium silvestre]|uniref:Zn-dependent peptidase ImmA (M78 family) n=2 Tax=Psychromicrobium silvestre TaxID=1645614 RepID=A0A7Y9LUQ0_9MICC|nr:Zn-dependent peptidase ImmA (M78 family) [Psychromicrobium silvestre]
MELDEERKLLLARTLSVPVQALDVAIDEGKSSGLVFHRKRATLPVSKTNQIRAILDFTRVQVDALLGSGRQSPTLMRTPLPEDGLTTPEEVAQGLRKRLALAPGPLPDIVQVLEQAGMAVVRRDLGSTQIDAIVSWPEGDWPLVLLGNHAPGDRQRFTLAHELGHAIMHQLPSEYQEQEADRFASEFLMPLQDIRSELKEISIPSLARLKSRWQVSMAALLRRARDIGTITEARYKALIIEMSRAGYRKREPVDIIVAGPQQIPEAIKRRLALGETPSDLAEAAHLTLDEFDTLYGNEER